MVVVVFLFVYNSMLKLYLFIFALFIQICFLNIDFQGHLYICELDHKDRSESAVDTSFGMIKINHLPLC